MEIHSEQQAHDDYPSYDGLTEAEDLSSSERLEHTDHAFYSDQGQTPRRQMYKQIREEYMPLTGHRRVQPDIISHQTLDPDLSSRGAHNSNISTGQNCHEKPSRSPSVCLGLQYKYRQTVVDPTNDKEDHKHVLFHDQHSPRLPRFLILSFITSYIAIREVLCARC